MRRQVSPRCSVDLAVGRHVWLWQAAPRQTERATGEVWRRCLSLIWRQGHGLLICKVLCLVVESQHRVLKGLDLLFLGVELLTRAAECLIRSTHLSVHDANAPLQDLALPCQLRVCLLQLVHVACDRGRLWLLFTLAARIQIRACCLRRLSWHPRVPTPIVLVAELQHVLLEEGRRVLQVACLCMNLLQQIDRYVLDELRSSPVLTSSLFD